MTMTINIPKNKVSFMTTMFSNLPFVGLNAVYDENEVFLDELEESARQAKAYMRGEINLRPVSELLDEL